MREYADVMSGVYCDGCGEGNLIPDAGGRGQEPVACDLCGWKADLADQPRKWMEDNSPPWTKRERKRAGTLFFLWLTFDPLKDDAVFGVGEILGLESMSSGGSAGASLVEIEKRPTEEHLRRIATVDGVTKVWLAR